MTTASAQPLYDAVARRAGLVLSVPAPQGLRHYKSHFVGEEPTGVWIESAGEAGLLDALIAEGRLVGVSFRGGDARHVFASPLLARQSGYEMGDDLTGPALLLAFPTEIRAVQRRSSYRVRVLPGSELSVRCWRMARRADLRDKPMDAQELVTEMRDISLGGLGVIFRGRDGQPPKVNIEDRLRIQVRYRELDLLLEGRMRPGAAPSGLGLRAGIRFVFIYGGIQDRRTLGKLTKIVGELRRLEARHRRQTSSKPAPRES